MPHDKWSVSVTLTKRSDGELRVSSADMPGLILSGSDATKIMAAIIPAIEALRAYKQRSEAGRAGGIKSAAVKKARNTPHRAA